MVEGFKLFKVLIGPRVQIQGLHFILLKVMCFTVRKLVILITDMEGVKNFGLVFYLLDYPNNSNTLTTLHV